MTTPQFLGAFLLGAFCASCVFAMLPAMRGNHDEETPLVAPAGGNNRPRQLEVSAETMHDLERKPIWDRVSN